MLFLARGEAPPEGYRLVFRAYYTKPDGARVYASRYGKKAWALAVPV